MQKIILITYFIFIASFKILYSFELKPFTRDYCTGYPEGTRTKPLAWKNCCLEQDLYFWAGGTLDDRTRAEQELKSCVKNLGFPQYASLIYLGVKIGSFSPLKLKGKWGIGWINRPLHIPLTNQEIHLITESINRLRNSENDKVIEKFIKTIHHRLP